MLYQRMVQIFWPQFGVFFHEPIDMGVGFSDEFGVKDVSENYEAILLELFFLGHTIRIPVRGTSCLLRAHANGTIDANALPIYHLVFHNMTCEPGELVGFSKPRGKGHLASHRILNFLG